MQNEIKILFDDIKKFEGFVLFKEKSFQAKKESIDKY